MDETDIVLLKALAQRADVTATELMADANLSIPAINKRIARLKSSGTIRRVTVLTEPKLVGKPIMAFVLIVLDRFSSMESLLQQVNADPDILECYAVTGEYDYLIKICAADIEAFEEKLLNLKTKNVAKSHTLLTLCEHKYNPTVLPD
jgi:Lrp/AsnC family leucine-responsive transcriptional regulator